MGRRGLRVFIYEYIYSVIMKRQDIMSTKEKKLEEWEADLRREYRALMRLMDRGPWVLQGSVNEMAPRTPQGRATYTWTRKVRAKTVTVALSAKQAAAFRRAIRMNRQMEQRLERLRTLSQGALLTSLPGVPKRRKRAPE